MAVGPVGIKGIAELTLAGTPASMVPTVCLEALGALSEAISTGVNEEGWTSWDRVCDMDI